MQARPSIEPVKYCHELRPRRTLYSHDRWGLEDNEPVDGRVHGRTACRAGGGGARGAGQERRYPHHLIGSNQTIDCNESTLIVLGANNTINALGTCWAVTVQGSGNLIVADNVINDITVYGSDQTVFYKTGDPVVWDRGRELGMMNRIDRIPA